MALPSKVAAQLTACFAASMIGIELPFAITKPQKSRTKCDKCGKEIPPGKPGRLCKECRK